MSERDELIARLRILDADDRRLPFHDMRLAAADLLERDGAKIADLTRWQEDAVRNCAQKRCGRKDARIAELERELAEAREERYPPIPPNGSAARSLGAYLADVLCEDQWARAEEMLLGIHAAYVALCAENETLRADLRHAMADTARLEWLMSRISSLYAQQCLGLVVGANGVCRGVIDAAKERTP